MILFIFFILFIFIFILLIILFCPVNINIFFDNEIKLIKISIFFLKFDIYNKNKKKIIKNKKIKNKNKNKNKNKKNKIINFKIIKKSPKIIKFIINSLKIIFKNFNLKKFHVLIKISSDEAKDSAIKYSFIQSVINIINSNSKLILNKNIRIFSCPCFYLEKTQIKSQIEFEFLGIKFLYLLLKIIFEFAKISKILLRE